MKQETPFDTIAAISTPPGEGGIGIVRISGEYSFEIVDSIFRPNRHIKPPALGQSFRMYLGHIVDNGRIIDEVLVSFMRAPHTYTRENIVEINCHGGAVAVNEVLKLVLNKGARLAEPGEFTRRAFINGRIDLTQAEAVLDIVRAKTARALGAAVKQLDGVLSGKIKEVMNMLKDVLLHLELAIDFAEEEIPPLEMEKLKNKVINADEVLIELIQSYNTGKLFKQGVLTPIIGKPNVGKSSILNAFLKFDRAIVTPLPGTTRDIIEEQLNISGIPFILADTAGITESEDLIEIEGIKRSKNYLERGQLILLIFDGSCPLEKRDIELATLTRNFPHIPVINKIDLPQVLDTEKLVQKTGINPDFIHISATQGKGLKELERRMADMVIGGETVADTSLMITSVRHFNVLQRAKAEIEQALLGFEQELTPEMLAFDIRNGMDILGEITGEITNQDILNEIFSNFCIGK